MPVGASETELLHYHHYFLERFRLFACQKCPFDIPFDITIFDIGGSLRGFTAVGYNRLSVGELPEVAGYIISAIIGVALLVVVFRLIANAMRPSVDFG